MTFCESGNQQTWKGDHEAGLREMNEKNGIFWKKRNEQFIEHLAVPGVLSESLRSMHAESIRLPLKFRRNLEELAESEMENRNRYREILRPEVLTELSRKGGKAKKPDELRRWILSVVERRPNITCPQLAELLSKQTISPRMADFDGEEIFLSNDKWVPLSGLKDRLSRAKKELTAKRARAQEIKNRATG